MKEKSIGLLLLSWIHDVLLFEGIYVFAASIWNVRGQAVNMLLFKGLFMLFPVVLSYIVSRRCRNFWIFLVFSLIVTWGMREVSKSYLIGGLTAFVCLFRCYVKIKQGEIRRKMKELPGEAGIQEDKEVWEVPTLLDSPRIIHCLIFVVMYLGVIYVHRYELLPILLGILAAELCVCLSYCYLERLNGFVRQNIRVANLPSGAMRKIGTGILLIGVIGLLIFMIPAAVYHEEPLSKIRFKPADTGMMSVEYYEEDTEDSYMMEELMRLKARAKETPEWLKKASEIVSVLTVFGIAYLALKLVFLTIRKAMESFSDDEDEVIFLEKEDDSREGKKGLLIRRKEREGFRSPDRRIRRFYKKLIKRSLRETPCGNETPLELENRAGLYDTEKEKIGRIHELYEKARYAEEECSKEEVKECIIIKFL